MLLEAETQWPVGKGRAKVAGIHLSRMVDLIMNDASNAFVKGEVSTKVPKKARLIQAHKRPGTAYQEPAEYYAINAALKTVMDADFECEGIVFHFIYAGGLSHDQLSKRFHDAWVCRGQHYWLDECDGANWDATMNKELLESEAEVYRMLRSPVLAAFVERCGGVFGRIRTRLDKFTTFVLRYFTAWKRLSGDWNTSCGNSIVSMIIRYTVLLALPTHLRPEHVTAFFLGDDYLALLRFSNQLPPRDVLSAALTDLERQCGITPERGLTQDPFLVSFISLGLWPTNAGAELSLQFVPHPARQLCKLFCTVKKMPPEALRHYSSEIARAFLPVFRGFEFMTGFLKYHFQPGMRDTPAYLQALLTHDHLYNSQFFTATDINWQAGFVYKYKLPITTLRWEAPTTYGCYYHPVVAIMLAHESSDPVDRM